MNPDPRTDVLGFHDIRYQPLDGYESGDEGDSIDLNAEEEIFSNYQQEPCCEPPVKMEIITAAIKDVYTHWGTMFVGKNDRILAYVLLLLMLTFSTLDISLDWTNYKSLQNHDVYYGLGTGPPMAVAIDMMFLFNVVGSILFVFEILNTLTLMTNGGHTKMPVELEQCFVLLFEEIPISVINLGVVLCRDDAITTRQTITCLVALLNACLRLYLYTYIKEKHYKYERTMLHTTFKLAVYITASVMVAMLFFTNAFIWHHARIGNNKYNNDQYKQNKLSGVSIFLLNYDKYEFPHTKVYNYSLNYMISDEVLNIDKPYMVNNITDLVYSTSHTFTTDFHCTHRRRPEFTIVPPACKDADKLKFKFKYSEPTDDNKELQPLGEIEYNYGTVTKSGNNTKCESYGTPLHRGWGLYYLTYIMDKYMNMTDVLVTTAWTNICVQPWIRYDPKLDPCLP